jgi:hypothetical protein
LSDLLWSDRRGGKEHLIQKEHTMKYLMLVGADPEADPNGSDAGTQDIDTWVSTNRTAGRWILGDRLRPAEDATIVRRRGGKLLVTDGPFAESREWIVGFDVLECRDLDEAIQIAAQHPRSAGGLLELRPFWPLGTGDE